jgi:uncharacterized protein (DUF58 family)
MTSLRARWQAWWQARLGASDHYTLNHRNVYILPSGAGLMLAVTLLCMLVATINFQLNMGYMLSFLLAGAAVVGMHLGHANLRGLQLRLQAPQAHFLYTPACLQVQLANPRAQARWGLGLAVYGGGNFSWTGLQAHSTGSVDLYWQAPRRGRNPLPLLTLETRFPMGMFRVWALWRPAATVLVYPQPEADAPPWPQGQGAPSDDAASRVQGGTEPEGVRPYRRGDALNTVVWKKAAKAMARGSHELLSRDTTRSVTGVLWLDLEDTGLREREAALSRLCAWVLRAQASGQAYGMRLPGQSIAPASGPIHSHLCLEALALC